MFQRLEGELRGTGDPRDQGFADMVAGALKVRGKDIVASSAVPIEKQSAEVEASIEKSLERSKEKAESGRGFRHSYRGNFCPEIA